MARQTGLVPAMRYRDVPATVDWLCKAFGCTPLRYVFAADGRIASAELLFGSSPALIGPVTGSAFDHLMVQPDHIGGAVTQCSYFVVPDADAHCARAVAAGAEIVLPPDDDGRGARSYACKDCEGHLWTFGTYDPLDANIGRPAGWLARAARQAREHGVPAVLAVGLVLALAGILMVRDARDTQRALGLAEVARAEAERGTKAAIAQLSEREAEKAETLRENRTLSTQLRAEHAMRAQAEQDAARAAAAARHALEAANKALSEEAAKRAVAQQSSDETRGLLERERQRREALATALGEVETKLTYERQARESADQQVRALAETLTSERASPQAIDPSTARTDLSSQEKAAMPSRTHLTAVAGLSAPSLRAIYQDPNAAFSFRFPSDRFQPDPASPSDHGPVFVSRDGRAHLLVYSGENVPGQPIEAYRRQLIAESFSDAKFDYVPVRKSWFVLSGTQGEEMFYLRITFACDRRKWHGWGLRYPVAERNVYDRIVEDVHRSYKHQSGACG